MTTRWPARSARPASSVESLVCNTTEHVVHPTLPLDPGNGVRAAEIAVGTIRGWGLAPPAGLRHECYVTGPVRLSAMSGFRVPPA